ncbi:hypothetical protein [Mesorhizobium sp. M0579]|uniref:hypothetical protein n=1 Tax=Mesorhizobium sp. M0579 TaxID=2956962 RepID=UPI00333B8FF7
MNAHHNTDAELAGPEFNGADLAKRALGFVLGTVTLAIFLGASMLSGVLAAAIFGAPL